jgi:hypothetical protein
MKRTNRDTEPEYEDEPANLPLERLTPPSKKPGKLKYQQKGFRIEISTRERAWKLLKYYRSEVDMRKAYRGVAQRDSRSYIDTHSSYRMVFPDGSIIPRIHDPSQPANWEYRRLRRQP